MFKVVFDEMILINAMLDPLSVCGQLIRCAKAGDFSLFLSREIINESRSMLITHKKQQDKYGYSDEEITSFFNALSEFTTLVDDIPFSQTAKHVSDRFIIATLLTAVKAEATHIVAGNNRIFNISVDEGLQVLSPDDFLRELGKKGSIVKPCPQCDGYRALGCSDCNGSGYQSDSPSIPCYRCNGSKEFECWKCYGKGWIENIPEHNS